jgi:hypothetical protein
VISSHTSESAADCCVRFAFASRALLTHRAHHLVRLRQIPPFPLRGIRRERKLRARRHEQQPSRRRKGRVFPKKYTLTLQHSNARLALNYMALRRFQTFHTLRPVIPCQCVWALDGVFPGQFHLNVSNVIGMNAHVHNVELIPLHE